MTNTTITFTIPNEKIQRIINAMKGIYPIPETDGTPDFTDNQWTKEALRRWVVHTVRRYETKVAQENIEVNADDEIIG